tara:strand:- start:870 stop:1292 length:423 start_codon:yes stop_codon:yes gene_type:complete
MTRALSIDYGDVRVGIAISDPMRIIGKPLLTLDNNEVLIEEIMNLINIHNVTDLVVGYPIGMKGQITEQTKKVDNFISKLESVLTIPITPIDERLSSVTATESLIKQGIKTGFNKAKIDETSAAIILQEFLDTKNNEKNF